MIAWLEPVISGAMSFAAQTVQTATTSGTAPGYTFSGATGATYGRTIDVTGTTFTSSFSYSESGAFLTISGTSTGTSTTSTSGTASTQTTAQQTLAAQTSTTETRQIGLTKTVATTIETNQWTVESFQTNGASEISFFTTQTTASDKTTSFETTTETWLTTTELSDSTVVANTFNTILLCEHSEVAMILTQHSRWSDWDGIGFAAENTTTGTRLTMSARVSNRNVQLFDESQTSLTEELAAQTISFSVSYQTTNSSNTETLTRYTYSVLPNSTQSYTQHSQDIETSQTEETMTMVAPFSHHSNTSTAISFVRWSATQLQVLLNGNTFSGLAQLWTAGAPESLVKTTVTQLNNYTFSTVTNSDMTVSASGDTTHPANDGLLEIQHWEHGVLFPYETANNGIAHIVKPYGVIDGDTVAGFATIASSSFSVPHLAYVDRQVPLMNFEFARALRTLTEYSDESVTISGKSLTYTVDATQATESQVISVEGEAQTGVVATKSVLGGTPEASATIYQSAPRGVFSLVKETETTTTVMAGGSTSIAPEEQWETSALFPIPHVSFAGRSRAGVNALVFNNQSVVTYVQPVYEYQSQSAY